MIDLVKVGLTKKPFGTEGQIKVNIDQAFAQILNHFKFLFIELDGSKIPFYIEEFGGSQQLCKLEEIDNPEKASQLSNKAIYLEKDILEQFITTPIVQESDDLVGFIILNAGEKVGKIDEIRIFPYQIMAVIKNGESEILIPLADELIESIDQKNKSIYMNLPDGLVELR